ncbi:MAG: hypothetical protein AAB019_05145, partial [Planctomycetota bacterium]
QFVYSLTDRQAKACLNQVRSEPFGNTQDKLRESEGIYELFLISAETAGYQVNPALLDDLPHPFLEAIESLYQKCNLPLTDEIRTEMNKIMKDVPLEIQLALARFLDAAGEAKYYRDKSFSHYPREKWEQAFKVATRSFVPGDKLKDESEVLQELGEGINYRELATGALANLRAIIELETLLINKELNLTPVIFEFNTPLGKVSFNSRAEDNNYRGDDYLLIIDLAGNDLYQGATAASWNPDHPISTVIDWTGDDTYIADEKSPCAQGAGIMGYGFLVDNGGADIFKAIDNAQGMSYFGVGILWVSGGDDTFTARAAAQGSASFGIANFVKKGGDDKYYCYFAGQGFGYVAGYGCLIDTGGNDRYVAEPYLIFDPASSGQHDYLRNYSFCQGVGWGKRGDFEGGYSMTGGTGILQDLAGNDRYECGVFGQASAYWYSTGILHDKAGNDYYEGSFFVQSGTAHMALSMLLDEQGDDYHRVWRGISLAGAHDLSVSWLIDKSGNDTVEAWEWQKQDENGEWKQSLAPTGPYSPKDESVLRLKGNVGILLGSAIGNSVAVYVDMDGDDKYELYSNDNLGFSRHGDLNPDSLQYGCFNIAMFIDAKGKDTYNLPVQLPDGEPVKNNSKWLKISPEGNQIKTFGMGLDTEAGGVIEVKK